MKVLDEAQVNQFLMAAHGSANEALYHLAIVTGMRLGEIYGLTWDDLHWHNGELNVHRRQEKTGRGMGFLRVEDPLRDTHGQTG